MFIDSKLRIAYQCRLVVRAPYLVSIENIDGRITLTIYPHPSRSNNKAMKLASRISTVSVSARRSQIWQAGEHTAIPTVTTKPIVGPITLQWQGFWSLLHISKSLAFAM